ncbi:hypothetical protein JZ751_011243 [Albula glossodonta]|uniref:Protein serine/threonine phosphatase 2C C-terminal domain-containing protein n=1 Tax=Albula glossodonta TaxID=121402 RepID=A0A8T2NZK6_9TELE|nr:hypothetical protein JZ751_011243 [Albula glossodonta]
MPLVRDSTQSNSGDSSCENRGTDRSVDLQQLPCCSPLLKQTDQTAAVCGSRDNMSVVLVCLPNAPKVLEEAVKKDLELDKYLESRVEEIIEKSGEDGIPDLVHVMRNLSTENIPNLPPGGGLASKRSVIEAVYNRLNPHREEDGDAEGDDDGSTTTHLLEALRQFRVNHRGECRLLLEEALSTYRLPCETGAERPDPDTEQPPSPPPSPAGEPEETEERPEDALAAAPEDSDTPNA